MKKYNKTYFVGRSTVLASLLEFFLRLMAHCPVLLSLPILRILCCSFLLSEVCPYVYSRF
jgi:hypothetical protein